MCGITGFIDFKMGSDYQSLKKMVASLKHRGPDDEGIHIWDDNSFQVGFGQSRLSIIDLTTGGHQPMHFEHLSIVFNGEIYNYKEIKKELQDLGHSFITESDTEVILHAYSQWGNEAVDRFIGMFAMAIFDRRKREITFIRDRAGVKPLFLYWDGSLLLFGSELKPFHEHPDFRKELDQTALLKYMQFGYVPSPHCIFKNAYKLDSGCIEIWNLDTKQKTQKVYWSSTDAYLTPGYKEGYESAKDELHALLKSSFNYRMVSDVPVGVFLSGGYDSTAVTAILQSERTEKLKTFTIGFEEGNNEAPFAKQTAEFLGTEHTEYICTTREAQDIIPHLPFYYDEPFGDSSAIPTSLVSKVAKEQVTVALSADAGDEVFAGYSNYQKLLTFQKRLNLIPQALKPLVASLSGGINRLIPDANSALKHKMASVEVGLHKNAQKQAAVLFTEMGKTPRHMIGGSLSNKPLPGEMKEFIRAGDFDNLLDPILTRDYQMYLQNDILTKVDRATMSVSLEGREPLVDHRILEFVAGLPQDFKVQGSNGKRILKDIVHQYVPAKLLDRPKTGFGLPIFSWLRRDLKYLLEEYLNEAALTKPGCWDVGYCLAKISLFKKNRLHYTPFIWYLLMFQMWYYRWMEEKA